MVRPGGLELPRHPVFGCSTDAADHSLHLSSQFRVHPFINMNGIPGHSGYLSLGDTATIIGLFTLCRSEIGLVTELQHSCKQSRNVWCAGPRNLCENPFRCVGFGA